MPKRVVIVGAGITGLTAAYDLEQRTDAEILLIERDWQVGGKIQTRQIDDFLVEGGPDCFFTHKKWALEFIEEIGLSYALQEPAANLFSMLIGGRLRWVPRRLLNFSAIHPSALNEAEFLSETAKEWTRNERVAPPGKAEDESIASFFRRRFGDEFSKLVAEPLLAGTHAGDPERLSMAALYPNYFQAEKKYGSLSASPQPSSSSDKPAFLSISGGMGTLPKAIQDRLERTQFLLRTNVAKVRSGHVITDRGIEIDADRILITTPSWAAADILDIQTLRSIPHASSAIVTLAFEDTEVAGTGFLVPQSEPSDITGATWSSEKWPGRATPDNSLVRVFMGRAGGLDVTTLLDEQLIAVARRELGKIVEVKGRTNLAFVSRWHNGLPQYEVGHLDRLREIEEELLRKPGIHLAGASYRGVGIPDCIRQGREAAARIIIEMA